MTFLILNLFSLGQWYYNPECQRAHWNQVGKIFKEEAEPKDAIIIQNSFQILAFEYYYPGSQAIYSFDKNTPNQNIASILKRYHRVWFISCYGWMVDPERKIAKWLGQNYLPVKIINLKNTFDPDGRIVIILFENNH